MGYSQSRGKLASARGYGPQTWPISPTEVEKKIRHCGLCANGLLALLQGLAGEAMAQSLRDAGAVARFNPIDLAHPASIQTFANAVRDQEGALHGLVNNGAIATNVAGMAFEDIEIDLWDKVMGVNAGFVFA